MKNKRNTFVALLVALPVLICANASASVVIDPFSEVDSSVTWPVVQNTVGTAPSVSESGLSTVLGGTRLTTLTAEALDTERLDEVQVGVYETPGILAYASSILGDGKLEILYDGGGAGLNADLSGDAWIEIELLAFDLANGTPMDITLSMSDGVNKEVISQTINTFGRQDVVFLFSKLSTLDLSDIDSIAVTFDPGFGADFRVGEISSVVPEPATLGLLLTGAVLGLRRKRR